MAARSSEWFRTERIIRLFLRLWSYKLPRIFEVLLLDDGASRIFFIPRIGILAREREAGCCSPKTRFTA